MNGLTEEQRRNILRAFALLSMALGFACFAGFVWVVFRAMSYCSSAIVPVLIGFVLALFFKPYYGRWLKWVKNPTLAVIGVLVTVFVPIALLLWAAGAVLVDQISNLIAQGPALVTKVVGWIDQTCPKLESLLEQFSVNIHDLSTLTHSFLKPVETAGAKVVGFVGGIFTFLLSLLFFVFFLMTRERRGSDIVSGLSFLKDETRAFLGEQIDVFFEILIGFFRRQTLICLIEGCFYGLGFLLVGLQYGFIVGFMLGVLNLVPFFGSIVCLPIALSIACFGDGGSGLRMILVGCVWLTGQLLDGYLITPKIQGNKTGLGYAGVIFSFIFWGALLGPLLGMLLAIPLSAFCVVLWRALNSRYFRPVI